MYYKKVCTYLISNSGKFFLSVTQNWEFNFLWVPWVPQAQNGPGRTWTDPDGSCHTLYQSLSHLVLDFVTLYLFVIPCTRLCNILYQTLLHLVPDPANILYQYTMSRGLGEPGLTQVYNRKESLLCSIYVFETSL